ncbi:MAG: type VI secretion system tip protein VgrG, partial [candidate division Zixibacteria bacterium]|nr:type VI secretion system tip protein VgrG [candidate division Zixibacteria bacterium]
LEDRAEIDEQGRYKVVMPFDLSGAGQGKASRYIRMAQPYGGKNQGMHFPLHKGTEVIWACVDG